MLKKISETIIEYLINNQSHSDPGVYMEHTMSGTVVRLKGDWTLTGITQKNINSLAILLELLGSNSNKNQKIDCKQITKFDLSGLQFLYTWLQCFKLRGIEPVLINLPNQMHKVFCCLEMQNCSSAA